MVDPNCALYQFYFNGIPFHPEAKLTLAQIAGSKSIPWSAGEIRIKHVATPPLSAPWRNFLKSPSCAYFGKSCRICICYLVGLTLLKSLFTSVAWRETRAHAKERLVLASIAIGRTLLVFVAVLLNWTEHLAEVVHGVQGRYFTIPILALAYALVLSNKCSQVLC